MTDTAAETAKGSVAGAVTGKGTSSEASGQAGRKSKARGRVYATGAQRTLAYTIDQLFITVLSVIFSLVLNIFAPAPEFVVIPPSLDVSSDGQGNIINGYGDVVLPSELPTDPVVVSGIIFEHWIGQMRKYAPLFLLSLLVPLIYFSLFTASRWQATPGMRLVKIRLTDAQGGRLHLGLAAWRTFAHFFTILTLGLGFYLPVAFTKRKQAIHDMISGAEMRVVDKAFEKERARRTAAARRELSDPTSDGTEKKQKNRQPANRTGKKTAHAR